jgi:hypothetical protein
VIATSTPRWEDMKLRPHEAQSLQGGDPPPIAIHRALGSGGAGSFVRLRLRNIGQGPAVVTAVQIRSNGANLLDSLYQNYPVAAGGPADIESPVSPMARDSRRRDADDRLLPSEWPPISHYLRGVDRRPHAGMPDLHAIPARLNYAAPKPKPGPMMAIKVSIAAARVVRAAPAVFRCRASLRSHSQNEFMVSDSSHPCRHLPTAEAPPTRLCRSRIVPSGRDPARQHRAEPVLPLARASAPGSRRRAARPHRAHPAAQRTTAAEQAKALYRYWPEVGDRLFA